MANREAPPAPSPPVPFPEAPETVELCSANVCAQGHAWPVRAGAPNCVGCGSPVLVIKMELCPRCNEPPVNTVLRTDWIAEGMQVVALCRGHRSQGDVGEIEIKRTAAPPTPVDAPVPDVPVPSSADDRGATAVDVQVPTTGE